MTMIRTSLLTFRRRISLGYTRLGCILFHRGQKYGEYNYVYHLDRVVAVAQRFGIDDLAFLKACLGHDLPEDQQTSGLALALIGMNSRSRRLIFAVTDEPGATREERKKKTYPKVAACAGATMLKLCDRIANVEENLRSGNLSKLERYRSEHGQFRRVCFSSCDPEAEHLWKHLEHLLFVV